MHIRIFLLTISVLSGLSLMAQQNQGGAIYSAKSRLGLKTKQVGKSIMHIDYAMNADTIGKEWTYIDLQRLEVGQDCSKYSSLFLSKRVSTTVKTRDAVLRSSTGGKNDSFWNDIQYTDLFFKNGKVTEYVTMPMWMESYNAQFTEDSRAQKWSLHPEVQTILGYRCQRATCHWRGRDFEAWFTTDIPVKLGPWRFNGLPGLILKVYDTDHFYTFEAVSIKKSDTPIMLYDFQYPVSSRSKVRKLQYALQVNFWRTINPSNKANDAPFEQLEKE